MELTQFSESRSLSLAKVKKLCTDLFGNIPATLSDEQISQLDTKLNTPSQYQSESQNLITGLKSESTGLRKRPQHSASIVLGEDYEKLYNLIPVEFQRQLDKLPPSDRVGVLLAAVEGIEQAEIKFLTKEAFESARLTQLHNQSNTTKLEQAKVNSNSRNDYSDFDTAEFIQRLEAESLLQGFLQE